MSYDFWRLLWGLLSSAEAEVIACAAVYFMNGSREAYQAMIGWGNSAAVLVAERVIPHHHISI